MKIPTEGCIYTNDRVNIDYLPSAKEVEGACLLVVAVMVTCAGVDVVSTPMRGAMPADIVSATRGMVDDMNGVSGMQHAAYIVVLRYCIRHDCHESEQC